MKNNKKIFIILYVLMCLFFLFFLCRYMINHSFVQKYELHTERTFPEKILTFLNINDPYTVYYNLGIAEYEVGNFEKAADYFSKSITYDMPIRTECSPRINLVLSRIAMIDLQKDAREDIIAELYACIDILCEKGCARNDGYKALKGHNKDAEKLKDELLAYIEALENPTEGHDPNTEQEENGSNSEEEKDPKEAELENIQKDSNLERDTSIQQSADKMNNSSMKHANKSW